MKGKSIYWPLFLTFVLVVALFLVGKAGGEIWRYKRLDGRAFANVERWEVKQLGTDRYGLIAHYSFNYKGITYSASSHWRGKRLLNRSAAEAKIVHLRDKKFYCYFPALNPSKAQIGRIFPLKSTLYALISLGVGIYFMALAYLIPQNSG